MIQRRPIASVSHQHQPTVEGLMNEPANKPEESVAQLSEHDLAQLAAKIYALLRRELQLERERWL